MIANKKIFIKNGKYKNFRIKKKFEIQNFSELL